MNLTKYNHDIVLQLINFFIISVINLLVIPFFKTKCEKIDITQQQQQN